MRDNPTFEEVKELLKLAAEKTDLRISFVDQHSGKAVYNSGEITIASDDSFREMKNEIVDKLKNKGIDPMKEKIDELKMFAEVFSDNVKDYRK